MASPTSRMPSAYRNLAKVVFLLPSSALTRFVADFSPMRSSWVKSCTVSLYRSAGLRTRSLSTSWSISLLPRPSISSARREAKCRSASLRCAGQNRPPVQRATASPSTRSTSESQIGHLRGRTTLRASGGRFSTMTLTISGMTSPARRITTVSPMCTSLRCTSSMLCSVALLTVTPPTNTGSSLATGVSAPVRPTWNSTPRTTVFSSCAGNLCAIAQRGARATKPRSRCC